jgi:ABC-type branched-subunit amino acid transport system ATPase component
LERGVHMADQVSLLVAGKIVYEAGGRTLSQEQLRAIYLGYTQGHT